VLSTPSSRKEGAPATATRATRAMKEGKLVRRPAPTLANSSPAPDGGTAAAISGSSAGECASALPFVTVLMPVRNEAHQIIATLKSLLAQDYPADRFEIVVMDGRSTDGTSAQVALVGELDARVRLFENPGVIVSTAINLGFGRARGSIVARADGHTRYATDYLRSAVRAFAESGADVVGGAMLATQDLSPFQEATARALSSRFGMGGAAFHFDGATGPAESVYLGVYRADALLRYGPFDEHLVRDEDDEWFARARRQGARIWLDARIRSTYLPRTNAPALFRQYFEYGLFKPAALRKVAGSWRARQLVPSALVAGLALPLAAAVVWPRAGLGAFALVALAYALATLLASRRALGRGRAGAREFLRQFAVFALMHLGYGAGFLAGLLRRAPDDSRAGMRSVYANYAADGARRRAWSERDAGQREIVAERDAALARTLRARFGERTRELRILDLGSGDRDLKAALARHGVAPRAVVATDLLLERLAADPRRHRVAADGRQLPFLAASFDVVVQCTVLTSVRATAARRVLAAEMVRVCRTDGLLLSYDARLPNPFNQNVRRLARDEHRELFAGCRVGFESLTLIPPLARRMPRLARWLNRLAALRAFDLATIDPPAATPRVGLAIGSAR
jgi:SAM-dependent methyltransferase